MFDDNDFEMNPDYMADLYQKNVEEEQMDRKIEPNTMGKPTSIEEEKNKTNETKVK